MNLAPVLLAFLAVVAPISVWGIYTDFSPNESVFSFSLYFSIAASVVAAAYLSMQLFWGAWVPRDLRPFGKRVAIIISMPVLLCGILFGFSCYGAPALYTLIAGSHVTTTAHATAIYKGYSKGGCRYILKSQVASTLSGDSFCSHEEEYRKASGGAQYEFSGKSSVFGFYIESRRLLYASNNSLKGTP